MNRTRSHFLPSPDRLTLDELLDELEARTIVIHDPHRFETIATGWTARLSSKRPKGRQGPKGKQGPPFNLGRSH